MAKREKIGEAFIEIKAELGELKRDLKSIETNTKKTTQKMGGFFSGAFAKITAGVLALRGVFNGLGKVINATFEQRRAESKVEQAIKSTGGAANRSAAEIKMMASELQKLTGVGDEITLNEVFAQLLTFTNITNKEFDRTAKVALDFATVLDGDLKSASIQLGKALNDPVANLSALSRSGIQFSSGQKAVIKELANTNRLAEAQNVILTELERQYGGQAKAAADAVVGSKQFGAAAGDLLEVIGEKLIPAFERGLEKATKFIEFFTSDTIDTAISRLKTLGVEAGKLDEIIKLNAVRKSREEIQELNDELSTLGNDFINQRENIAKTFQESVRGNQNLVKDQQFLAKLAKVYIETLRDTNVDEEKRQKILSNIASESKKATLALIEAGDDATSQIKEQDLFYSGLLDTATKIAEKTQLVANLEKEINETLSDRPPPEPVTPAKTQEDIKEPSRNLLSDLEEINTKLKDISALNQEEIKELIIKKQIIESILKSYENMTKQQGLFDEQLANILDKDGIGELQEVKVDAEKPKMQFSELEGILLDVRKAGTNAMDSLTAGISRAIVGGKSLNDVLKNIGNMLLSTVLNIGLSYLSGGITGALGIGVPAAQFGGSFKGGTNGITKMANGGSFTVPQGFPNDSFPMLVQSGERVEVTPANQSSGSEILMKNIDNTLNKLVSQSANQVVRERLIRPKIQGVEFIEELITPAQQRIDDGISFND